MGSTLGGYWREHPKTPPRWNMSLKLCRALSSLHHHTPTCSSLAWFPRMSLPKSTSWAFPGNKHCWLPEDQSPRFPGDLELVKKFQSLYLVLMGKRCEMPQAFRLYFSTKNSVHDLLNGLLRVTRSWYSWTQFAQPQGLPSTLALPNSSKGPDSWSHHSARLPMKCTLCWNPGIGWSVTGPFGPSCASHKGILKPSKINVSLKQQPSMWLS